MRREVFFAIIPILLGAGLLLFRGVTATSRSRQFGTIAVALAVLGLIPGLVGTNLTDPAGSDIPLVCAVAAVAIGVLVVVLALLSFQYRSRDQGVSLAYPLLGLAFGLGNLLCGSLLFYMVSTGPMTSAGTPWAWRSDPHGFEVMVPSEKLVTQPNPENVVAIFHCPKPYVYAAVVEVKKVTSDAQYDAAIADSKLKINKYPLENKLEKAGKNGAGRPYSMTIGDAFLEGKPYVVGSSVTRVDGKAVVLFFQGERIAASRTGPEKDQEYQLLRSQAEGFLGSVK